MFWLCSPHGTFCITRLPFSLTILLQLQLLWLWGLSCSCHRSRLNQFLAKIWWTMGTPAMWKALQSCQRPAPQANFFLEGASASESDFVWILSGFLISLYLPKMKFLNDTCLTYVIIVTTWWKVWWTSENPKKTLISFTKFYYATKWNPDSNIH